MFGIFYRIFNMFLVFIEVMAKIEKKTRYHSFLFILLGRTKGEGKKGSPKKKNKEFSDS